MLIFYDKGGNIVGTIEGRITSEEHLNMSMDNTEKLVVNWIGNDKDGDFTPDVSEDQKDIFIDLDKNPGNVFKYKVDTKTKTLAIK